MNWNHSWGRTVSEAKFIVFEGIDGSGTSTQSRALAAELEKSGARVHHTWEPSTRPVGLLLRQMLSGALTSSRDPDRDRHLFALLFAADRHDHLWNEDNGICALLSRGHHVVCARYVLSSLAYEGDHPEEEKFVTALNADFPVPDLTIYLDCPVTTALDRIRSTREQIDVFENEQKLSRVHAHYDRLLSSYPGAVLRLDATLPRHELTECIVKAFQEL